MRMKFGRWIGEKRRKPKRRKPGADRFDTYAKQREQWLSGSSGAAGPCKRICPQTGDVLEIIERESK